MLVKSSSIHFKTLSFRKPCFYPFSLIQNLPRIWGWSKRENFVSWWEHQCWWTKIFKFPKRISNDFEKTVFRQLSLFEFQVIFQKLCIFWENTFWRKCVVWKDAHFIVLEIFKLFRKIKRFLYIFYSRVLFPFQIWFQTQFSVWNLKFF